MEKYKLNIKDSIADTLLITLYAKSTESRKENPLINDLSACKIVSNVDYDFSKYKNKKASSVGVVLRANHFDCMVSEYIQQHIHPVVVLLGCGLDARVKRIGSIAEKAVFYELDIEEVIALRKELIPPASNEHLISSSMFDTAWMDHLQQKHPEGNFIFIIEGVLMYFNEEQNQYFFREIAKRFKGAELHFDMLNKWMSGKTKLHDTVSKSNASFKFGLDDETEIEQWHPTLHHQKTYIFNDFPGWRRMGFLLTTLMSIIPEFKTSSRLLTYTVSS